MSKITHEQAKESLLQVYIFNDIKINENNYVLVTEYIKQQEKQEQLVKLYRDFFDKLEIELRNTFDIDYIYPHEFILGNDIKSENKEFVELFKKIKELENE